MPLLKHHIIEGLTIKGAPPENICSIALRNPRTKHSRVKDLRYWQQIALDILKDERFGTCIAFGGSGKTVLLIAIGIHQVIKSDGLQKQLILTTQRNIARGFVGTPTEDYLQLKLNGDVNTWKVAKSEQFCDGQSLNVRNRLRDWLLWKPRKGAVTGTIITGVIAVASHHAFAMVWKSLTEAQRKRAIKNLTLHIDEAHYVKGVFDEDDDYTDAECLYVKESATILGSACRFIIAHRKDIRSSRIVLASATMFRHEGVLLSPSIQKRFTKYQLKWNDHYRFIEIPGFEFLYEDYRISPVDPALDNVRSEPEGRHIIFVPRSNEGYRVTDPGAIDRLFAELRKTFPADQILDLVNQDPEARRSATERLLREPKSADEGEPRLRVIVTCRVGTEGLDWCPCDRVHITNPSSSLTRTLQIMMRAFRKFDGKGKVKIFTYIPALPDLADDNKYREVLSDRTNAILAKIVWSENFVPIELAEIPKAHPKSEALPRKDQSASGDDRQTLESLFGGRYEEARREVLTKLLHIKHSTSSYLNDAITEVLQKYSVEDTPRVREGMQVLALRILGRNSPILATIDVSFLRAEGFDKIIFRHRLHDCRLWQGMFDGEDNKRIESILASRLDRQAAMVYDRKFNPGSSARVPRETVRAIRSNWKKQIDAKRASSDLHSKFNYLYPSKAQAPGPDA